MTERRNDRAAYDGSPSPCDSCSRKSACASQELACIDLQTWLNWGSDRVLRPEENRVALHRTFIRIYRRAA